MRGANENTIEFSVRDLGKGIESRYQSQIFDRYFRAPKAGEASTGLGLSISKEFIEAQSGTIGVESEIGKGSKFFFRDFRWHDGHSRSLT